MDSVLAEEWVTSFPRDPGQCASVGWVEISMAECSVTSCLLSHPCYRVSAVTFSLLKNAVAVYIELVSYLFCGVWRMFYRS